MDQSRTAFHNVLVARTIRAIEETGPLEDAQAIRDAARTASTREQQVIERAWILADRIGLAADLMRLRHVALLAVAAAAVVVVLLTYVLITSVISDGRTINIGIAFLGVLGPHLLSLTAWLLATLSPGSIGFGKWFGAGLASLAMWLGAKSPSLAGRHGPALLRQGTDMFRRARLLPWTFGLVNHGIWAGAFALLIPMLLLTFAFRSYHLTWESTILPPEFFVGFVHYTGWLPAALHLPAADIDLLRAPGGPDVDHRLALWLVSCVLVYGFLPRFFLLLLCGAVWHRRKNAIKLETAEPYSLKLFNRFDQLGTSTIVDAEQPPQADGSSANRFVGGDPNGALVWVGFELPPEFPWPLRSTTSAGHVHLRIAGASEERRSAIDLLSREPARKILLVCNGATSPDRGTERFFRDASAHCRAVGLLLVEPGGARGVNLDRWVTWLKATALDRIEVFTKIGDANAWGERRNG